MPLPVPQEFDSPGVEVGDKIELFESNLAPHEPLFATVVRVDHLGNFWVCLDLLYGEWKVSPSVTAWKLVGSSPVVTAAQFGVKCTKCQEFYEYAAVVEKFVCYPCRH